VGITLAGGTTRLGAATTLGGAFVTQLMWINIALAIFNMIPAFPMDGGRVLRAVLALRLDRERATDVAAACGKICAVVFALIGLYANVWLVLIAAFVWFGASQERALVHLQAALAGVPVREAMLKRVDTVAPEERLDATASLLVADGVDVLPIFDHGRPVGAITREDIAAGLARGGPDATVAEAPRHDLFTVAPDEPLDTLFERLQKSPGTVALVVDHGAAVGTLTAEHLARYVALHEMTG
jgi:CBS domain-containing protein